jgi:hypothetical protein
MTTSYAPIAGIIAIEPLPLCGGDWSSEIDDSSLGALLDSFARSSSLAVGKEAEPIVERIVTSTRWRVASEAADGPTIQADLLRLSAELDDEHRALGQ